MSLSSEHQDYNRAVNPLLFKNQKEVKTMSEQKPSEESWDGLLTNFLKASDLKEDSGFIIPTEVDVGETKDKKPYMRLTIEVNGIDKQFDLNKTNRNKLVELGIARPKDVIGKKLGYKKTLARNPQTQKEVDAIRITSIQ